MVGRGSGQALVGGRALPQVDAAVHGVAVDGVQLGLGEAQVLHRTHQVHDLLGLAGADQRRGHALVAQHPGRGHLRQALAAGLGDFVERAHMLEVLLAQVVLLEGAAAGAVDAGVGGHTVQVLVGEQALGQRAEGDAAHAGVIQRVQQVFLDPTVHQAVGGLVDQHGHAHALENGGRLACLGGGVAADAGVQRLALLHGRGQRTHGFFQRGVGVEAVAVEDVHVVQAHALQALVQAGQHVLARAAALAVGAGPHVVAGLAGDDQLVAVGLEVALQVLAKIGLGAAVGRAVVVGQVEVGDAQVKGRAQHVALGLEGRSVAEVVPQAQRDGGELEAAFAAGAVGNLAVVALGLGVVMLHGGEVGTGKTRSVGRAHVRCTHRGKQGGYQCRCAAAWQGRASA